MRNGRHANDSAPLATAGGALERRESVPGYPRTSSTAASAAPVGIGGKTVMFRIVGEMIARRDGFVKWEPTELPCCRRPSVGQHHGEAAPTRTGTWRAG